MVGPVRLYGCPVRTEHVRTLADLLLRVGRADDLAVAERLENALRIDAKLMALSPAERATILGALDDPPDGLCELRGELMRDQRLAASLAEAWLSGSPRPFALSGDGLGRKGTSRISR